MPACKYCGFIGNRIPGLSKSGRKNWLCYKCKQGASPPNPPNPHVITIACVDCLEHVPQSTIESEKCQTCIDSFVTCDRCVMDYPKYRRVFHDCIAPAVHLCAYDVIGCDDCCEDVLRSQSQTHVCRDDVVMTSKAVMRAMKRVIASMQCEIDSLREELERGAAPP